MGRFVPIDPGDLGEATTSLTLRAGDLLTYPATGGMVLGGEGSVELVGVYTAAVLTTAGTILSPEGPPNIVVFAARAEGRASVDLFLGDPYGPHRTLRVNVTVEP